MKRLNYAFTFVLAVVAMGVFALAPSALQAQYCDGLSTVLMTMDH